MTKKSEEAETAAAQHCTWVCVVLVLLSVSLSVCLSVSFFLLACLPDSQLGVVCGLSVCLSVSFFLLACLPDSQLGVVCGLVCLSVCVILLVSLPA